MIWARESEQSKTAPDPAPRHTAVRQVHVDTVITNIASFAKGFGMNYKELKLYNPWLRENKLNNKIPDIQAVRRTNRKKTMNKRWFLRCLDYPKKEKYFPLNNKKYGIGRGEPILPEKQHKRNMDMTI